MKRPRCVDVVYMRAPFHPCTRYATPGGTRCVQHEKALISLTQERGADVALWIGAARFRDNIAANAFLVLGKLPEPEADSPLHPVWRSVQLWNRANPINGGGL